MVDQPEKRDVGVGDGMCVNATDEKQEGKADDAGANTAASSGGKESKNNTEVEEEKKQPDTENDNDASVAAAAEALSATTFHLRKSTAVAVAAKTKRTGKGTEKAKPPAAGPKERVVKSAKVLPLFWKHVACSSTTDGRSLLPFLVWKCLVYELLAERLKPSNGLPKEPSYKKWRRSCRIDQKLFLAAGARSLCTKADGKGSIQLKDFFASQQELVDCCRLVVRRYDLRGILDNRGFGNCWMLDSTTRARSCSSSKEADPEETTQSQQQVRSEWIALLESTVDDIRQYDSLLVGRGADGEEQGACDLYGTDDKDLKRLVRVVVEAYAPVDRWLAPTANPVGSDSAAGGGKKGAPVSDGKEPKNGKAKTTDVEGVVDYSRVCVRKAIDESLRSGIVTERLVREVFDLRDAWLYWNKVVLDCNKSIDAATRAEASLAAAANTTVGISKQQQLQLQALRREVSAQQQRLQAVPMKVCEATDALERLKGSNPVRPYRW